MSFISAIGKGIARAINHGVANNQRKNAKKVAYNTVGEKMKKAKKKGTYFDGAEAYKRELRNLNKRITRRETAVDNFIGDL